MISGKRVVVMAGSSGIGLEAARLAAERGASVLITGRNAKRLEAAAASISSAVTYRAFDATDRDATAAFFAECGPIDHLVSCVGDTSWGSFLKLEETRAREVFEGKFWAQLLIVRLAHSIIAQDGSIVLTAGTAADRGSVPYAAAFSVLGNSALEVLVKGLAAELAPIRINLIEPTVTDTPIFANMIDHDKKEFFESFARVLPIRRIPTPREVALSYIHLMESTLINGDRVRPDGGPHLLLRKEGSLS